MEFHWKVFLAVTVTCGISYVIIRASDPSQSSLAEEADNTKTDEETDKKTVADESEENIAVMEAMINHLYDDITSEVKVNSEESKMRPKRSVNSTLTKNMDNTTAAGTKDEDEEEMDEATMRIREATARLSKHLRNLPVSLEHTIPYVYTPKIYGKVPLFMSIKVLSVFEINDVKQTIKTGLYISLQWWDTALAWNVSLYENVNQTTISPKSIWIPPVFVGNSRSLEDVMEKTKIMSISHNGNITIHNAVLLETSCNMNLSCYPYDEQTCTIKFLSQPQILEWIVDEKASDKELSRSLALNSEWELINVSTRMYLESGENPFPEVVMRLRRKTRFYSVCLIQPMVVTSYMNTLVFLVPLQSGEKISFLVTLYVSTSVFTSFFSTTMPRGLNNTPISMKLLIGVIVESVLVLLATLLVLKRFHAEEEASAVSRCNQEKDPTYRQTHDNNDPIKQLESNNGSPPHTTEPQPQSLQDLSQSGGVGIAWLSSCSPSVTPLGHAGRASRATRFCGLRGLTSRQLDRILFIIFLMGNSIFLLALLYNVL